MRMQCVEECNTEARAKAKLLEEIRKLQIYDPDVIQMQCGGYGKIIENVSQNHRRTHPESSVSARIYDLRRK